jgi:hypothetical protein
VTILEVLTDAQRLLVGDRTHGPGWAGPENVIGHCKRHGGVDALGLRILELCGWDDEMVIQYSVEGALRAAARNDGALVLASWEALRAIVAPSIVAELNSPMPTTLEAFRLWRAMFSAAQRQQDLDQWLCDPARTLKDVLGVFDQAVLKAKKGFDS